MPAAFFSVVIPTRSRPRMLREALRSLLWQTCPDFECLVLDNGTMEDTRKAVDELSGDRRFQYRHVPGRGLPFCRNEGLRHSSGRFLTFLDDDDLWLPNRLEEFKAAALAKPATSFWFSNAYIWRFERVIGTAFDPARPIPEGRVPGYYAIGDKHLPYFSTTMSIARDAVERAGAFNEDLPIFCDTEMVARVLNAGFESGVLRRPLAVRRLHEDQATADYEQTLRQGLLALKAGVPPLDVERLYRQELTLDNAVYLIKSLQTKKARALLDHAAISRDGRYYLLSLCSRIPVFLLRALRRLRKLHALIRGRGFAGAREYLAVEAAVRTILN